MLICFITNILYCLKGSQSIIVRCTVDFYWLIKIAIALKMFMTIFSALLMVLVYAAAFIYCKSTHKLKQKTFFFFPLRCFGVPCELKKSVTVLLGKNKWKVTRFQNTHSRCLSKWITRISHCIWALHIIAVIFSFC